jgi:hypothetical protein
MLAWEFYDDNSMCFQFKNCLDYNRAIILDNAFDYFHGNYYSDDYDIYFLVAFYWANFVASCIPVLGPSLVSVIGFTMWLYVTIIAGIQFNITLAAGINAFEPE